MIGLLREMRIYDDENKEFLSQKEYDKGQKKLGWRNGSSTQEVRNGKLNPLDRQKSPNGGTRLNSGVNKINCDINLAPNSVMTSIKSMIKPPAAQMNKLNVGASASKSGSKARVAYA